MRGSLKQKAIQKKKFFERKFFKIFSFKYLVKDFARITGWPMFRLLLNPKLYYHGGADKKRRIKGGALIISNHPDMIGAPLIDHIFFKRRLGFVTANETIKKSKLQGWFLKKMGCIPINRDAPDFNTFRRIVRLLRGGKVLLMFPEGKLAEDAGSLAPFMPGATLMALQGNVPVIPVYAYGKNKIFRRARIMIGAPIDFNEHCEGKPAASDVERLTRLLEERVGELKISLDGIMSAKSAKKSI